MLVSRDYFLFFDKEAPKSRGSVQNPLKPKVNSQSVQWGKDQKHKWSSWVLASEPIGNLVKQKPLKHVFCAFPCFVPSPSIAMVVKDCEEMVKLGPASEPYLNRGGLYAQLVSLRALFIVNKGHCYQEREQSNAKEHG